MAAAQELATLQAENVRLKEELTRLQYLDRLTSEEKQAEGVNSTVDQLYSLVNSAKDAFDNIDADGSGSIDASELSQLAARLNQVLEGEQLQEAMKALDKNGNGKIEFYEFLAWWSSRDSGVGAPESIGKLLKLKAALHRQQFEEMGNKLVRQLSEVKIEKPSTNSFRLSLKVGDVGENPNTSLLAKFTTGLPVFQENMIKAQARIRLRRDADQSAINDLVQAVSSHMRASATCNVVEHPEEEGIKALELVSLMQPIDMNVVREIPLEQFIKKCESSLRTNLCWDSLLVQPEVSVVQDAQIEINMEAELERMLFNVLAHLSPDLYLANLVRNLQFQSEAGDLAPLLDTIKHSSHPAKDLVLLGSSPEVWQSLVNELRSIPLSPPVIDALRKFRDTAEEVDLVTFSLPNGYGVTIHMKGMLSSKGLVQSDLGQPAE